MWSHPAPAAHPVMKINQLKTYWHDSTHFLLHDLWSEDAIHTSGPFGFLLRALRVLILLIKGFRDDELPIHAAALSFATVMSLIPILAIIFSVLQGIGAGQSQINLLLDWVHQMPPQFQSFVERIVEVAQKTNFAALGSIGLVVLIVFATAVLSNMEKTFNRIWGITKYRNPLRRIINYISIIVVVPVMIGFSGTIAAFFNSPVLMEKLGTLGFIYSFLLQFFPYLIMWMAIYLLYFILPYTEVAIKPALFASLMCAIILLLWQSVYIDFQLGVGRRNAIYGTFASIPIFLAWLYISWMILLLGAKTAFALQNEDTIHIEKFSAQASLDARVIVALSVLTRCGEALQLDKPPFEINSFAIEHHVPVRLLNDICEQLVHAGWISERAEHPGSYLTQKAPRHIQISDILHTILDHGASPHQLGIAKLNQTVNLALEHFEQAIDQSQQGQTVEQLLGTLQ